MYLLAVKIFVSVPAARWWQQSDILMKRLQSERNPVARLSSRAQRCDHITTLILHSLQWLLIRHASHVQDRPPSLRGNVFLAFLIQICRSSTSPVQSVRCSLYTASTVCVDCSRMHPVAKNANWCAEAGFFYSKESIFSRIFQFTTLTVTRAVCNGDL